MAVDAAQIKHAQTVNTLAALIAELLFVLLPFIVLFFVFTYLGRGVGEFFATPEWGFGAALLFGQTLVKFVSGFAKDSTPPERLGATVAALIVVGLVPSLVVLALTLIAPMPRVWLMISQLFLFTLSVVAFVSLGGAATLLTIQRGSRERR